MTRNPNLSRTLRHRPVLRHDVVVFCFFPDRNRSAVELVLVRNEFVEDETRSK